MAKNSSPELLEEAINSFGDLFYVFTPEGAFVEWNTQFTNVTGYSDEEISELNVTALVPESERERLNEALDTVSRDSTTVTISTELETKTKDRIPYEFQLAKLDNSDRNDNAVASIGREITDSDREAVSQLMSYQSQGLSVPIVEIWDGILLSTVIGKLSSAEAEMFTDALLDQIAEKGASIAIIDITGADSVDTQTAQHLIDTIHAVKLMGGQTIITGLNPNISQTLVKLGIAFDVETRSSLQDGLKTALKLQEVAFD
ncbi:Signal transduction histidine kinase (plasmid) [Halanaeroarchaeum sp. HSR-CO]|uniref:PAS domain S-box protein n=1 Tax=Halanaeroarchaeum sp. HSR-CO TaxID=2866382 RepID=UPI00217E5F26|nr:PAS domain S-box protein [Halanaeroarchaeum sp. HSR-CO]UWG49162.1 Signal transduction histidine kinase [Halanaeroarchaeum sp. HSR-CO]